jgi:hypothetical protein
MADLAARRGAARSGYDDVIERVAERQLDPVSAAELLLDDA